ncbi:MAG: hypothetical protein ACE14V_04660 [bacterium]
MKRIIIIGLVIMVICIGFYFGYKMTVNPRSSGTANTTHTNSTINLYVDYPKRLSEGEMMLLDNFVNNRSVYLAEAEKLGATLRNEHYIITREGDCFMVSPLAWSPLVNTTASVMTSFVINSNVQYAGSPCYTSSGENLPILNVTKRLDGRYDNWIRLPEPLEPSATFEVLDRINMPMLISKNRDIWKFFSRTSYTSGTENKNPLFYQVVQVLLPASFTIVDIEPKPQELKQTGQGQIIIWITILKSMQTGIQRCSFKIAF